jgi:succinate dehydrogenase / fumarate reductase cytochrome b subunit
MAWVGSFYRSTIGKKVVMALTGIVLVGYVMIHSLGNLLLFRGPEEINSYAAFLRESGALLWTVRAVLLGSFFLHIHAAWALTVANRAARPAPYTRLARRAATLSALSLRVGGVVLLLFVVFHILHLTTGTVHPAFSPLDVYNNLLIAFSVPLVTAFYLVAMVALGLHLHHGIWSAFQTLGVNHPHLDPVRRAVAIAVAVLVWAGFSSIPLAVAFGLLH